MNDPTDQGVAPGVIECPQGFLRKRGFARGFRVELSVGIGGPVVWLLLLLLLLALLRVCRVGAEIWGGEDVGGGTADVLDGGAELGEGGVGGWVWGVGAKEGGGG